jgi:hypothetical protein
MEKWLFINALVTPNLHKSPWADWTSDLGVLGERTAGLNILLNYSILYMHNRRQDLL